MLQVARLASRLLDDATGSIQTFLEGQFNTDGGACDRAGQSDVYYTVFALEGLLALQASVPTEAVTGYLRGFGDGFELDLVHTACLARCWASIPGELLAKDTASAIARNLERFRSADGGYNPDPVAERGTVYHAFLGLGAHQDLGSACPDTDSLADSVAALRSQDGAYANTPGLRPGSTTVTAAAVTLLRYLDRPIPGEVGAWLLARAHTNGGFVAAPQVPLPDLLSTATALHGLAGMQVDFSAVREASLDFVDTLWTGSAFCGHWADDVQDSEYTYYALLALGHLSL